MPVQVLPQKLINQIAAGEVVVRMASVAKELVENSIDAGATRIEIAVSNELRDLEIRDDGCGMDRNDAELCLQRHATSKIRTADDLFDLRTRGFRGEAMPSIASVSRMEIRTRPATLEKGTRIAVEGGRIDRIETIGCAPGTQIQIRDLFFNMPARLKFLKSRISEMNAILVTITRQALTQPHIGFRVERDGRPVMELPAGQTLGDRVRSLLGDQIKRGLLAMEFERDGVRVTGLLAHPHDARGDRRSQYLFANARPFSSKPIASSLEQACRGFVMAAKFPIYCAFIEVPPGDVDFNVHPTKEEVRFRDERNVAGAIFHAAREALEGSPALVGEVTLPDNEEPPNRDTVYTPQLERPAPPMPGFMTSPTELIRHFSERKRENARQQDWIGATTRPAAPAYIQPRTALRRNNGEIVAAGPGERPDDDFWNRGYDPEPLGQIAETYILVRFGEDLLIVDQHAAHERIVYLDLARRDRRVDRQQLLVPVTMQLEPAQGEAIRDLAARLSEYGFDVEEFGPRTWGITSLPADLPEFDPVPMIVELLGDLEEARRVNALEELRDRILIRAACHSAIRAGDRLPPGKMRELLAQMKRERLSFTCPHGRPTIVRLSKGELDRQFKRVV